MRSGSSSTICALLRVVLYNGRDRDRSACQKDKRLAHCKWPPAGQTTFKVQPQRAPVHSELVFARALLIPGCRLVVVIFAARQERPPMYTKAQLLDELKLFELHTGGLGSWITDKTDSEVFERLGRIGENPVTKVQLNQLLAFGHEAPVSEDFFRYYWLEEPAHHPYDVTSIPDFSQDWRQSAAIMSLAHLKWGLYRIFTDGLLWFGNVRTAYRKLRSLNAGELQDFFRGHRFDTRLI